MALYKWRGTGSAYWLPDSTITITDLTSIEPSAISHQDALDLSESTTGVTGFETSTSMVDVPILKYDVSPQIAGDQSFGSPQLVVVDDDGVDVVAQLRQQVIDLLDKGASGVLVFFLHTQEPTAGDRYYAIRLNVVNQVPTLSLDSVASTVGINFAAQTELVKGALAVAS